MAAPMYRPDGRPRSWRCRRGRHSWLFVSSEDHRRVDVPGHTIPLCILTERCPRCGMRSIT